MVGTPVCLSRRKLRKKHEGYPVSEVSNSFSLALIVSEERAIFRAISEDGSILKMLILATKRMGITLHS